MANQYVCDWLPYRRSNTYYRTLHALRPEDWSGTSLTNKADDLGRFVEIAANGTSTWLPVNNSLAGELICEVMLRPGLYGTFAAFSLNALIEARIDVAAGLLRLYWGGVQQVTAALPATMWTSSSVYSDAWLRIRWDVSVSPYKVFGKVWSINEAEPGAFTTSFTKTGIMPAVVTDPNGIGSSGIGTVSACRFFGYSDAWSPTPPAYMADRGYFDKWFKLAGSERARRVLAAEIFIPAWNGSSTAAYTTDALRIATEGYDGGVAWPFSNQTFVEGILEWPNFARKAPDDITGRRDFSVGDLVIANPNGIRDDWLRAKMNNAFITLRYGDPAWPWYDLRTLFTGAVMEISEEPGRIKLKLRDTAGRFDRAVHRSTLSTSNASNGKPTPISAGLVFNATPVTIDSSLLIYQVGEANVSAISEVRDKGVALSNSTFTVVSFSPASDFLRTSVAHGLQVGDAVSWASGSLPSPLTTGTTYYVQAVPASDTFTVAATKGGAVINLTGTGESTVAITYPGTDIMDCGAAHGFAANDQVKFSAGCPSPLVAGTTYFVSATNLSTNAFSVSLTSGGAVIDLTATTLTINGQSFSKWGYATPHGYVDNQEIITGTPTPTSPPITANTRYWVFAVNTTEHGFRTSNGGAQVTFSSIGAATGSTSPNVSGFSVYKPLSLTGTFNAFVLDAATAKFTLSRNPAGQITFDGQGQKLNGVAGTTGYHALGVLIGQRDPQVSIDVAAGTIGMGRDVGIWLDETANLVDMIDLLARSTACLWTLTRLGTLTFRYNGSPFGISPSSTIVADDCMPDGQLVMIRKQLPVAFNNGARVGFKRNFTVQRDADLAGSVTAANRALYAAEWSIKVMNAGSSPAASLDDGAKGELRTVPLIETCILSDADANFAGQNALIHYTKQLAWFTVTVRWSALDQFLEGQTTNVKIGRYGINPATGQTMLILGVEEDIKGHTAKLTLLAELTGYYPVTT